MNKQRFPGEFKTEHDYEGPWFQQVTNVIYDRNLKS